MFNGYYFNIGEVGVNWLLGEGNHPGQFGIGLWRQTGVLSAPRHQPGRHRRLLSVRLATRRISREPGVKNSSVSAFYQVGANNSQTMPITQ